MSNYTEKDRTIALAGVFQAARLTRDFAREGNANIQDLQTGIDSLFELNPASVASVFGSLDGVKSGLRCLLTQLDQPTERNVEITRYAANIIQLAKKIMDDKQRLDGLGEDLDNLQSRMTAFEFDQSTVIAQLAKIYQDRISTVSPRIMIKGEPLHLQNETTAARIRTCLLAGIRAAHLWVQCGGNRWQLLFKRGRTVRLAQELVDL